MLPYHHFTEEERKCLQKLLEEGYSIRKIAEILEKSPSSVSREIKRNKSKKGYNFWRAQSITIARRRAKKHQALVKGTEEWKYIIEGLEQYWSPETICNRWAEDYPDRKRLCASTIYRYIKAKKFPKITAKAHLRRRGRRRVYKTSNYQTIHPDRLIPEWTDQIKNRVRLGDWEGDTIYGGVGKGYLVTLVDRRSRYLLAGYLPKRDAILTRQVIEQLLQGQPVNSMSLDNGSEFAEFRELEKNIKAPVYFAEPHSPWQRGTNENTNDILRFFFPKGYDFRTLTQEHLQHVLNLINNRPRKCLGWLSPREFCEKNLLPTVALT